MLKLSERGYIRKRWGYQLSLMGTCVVDARSNAWPAFDAQNAISSLQLRKQQVATLIRSNGGQLRWTTPLVQLEDDLVTS